MRIEQLEHVLTVARYGSLSRAAANIYVGQPTLSASISSLEKELGRPLFRRTRRGMVLTQLGEDLLPLIEKTIDDFYAIKKRAGAGAPTHAHVHLTACEASKDVICEAISRSRDIYPSVHYYLHQALADDILYELSQKKAVLGLSTAFDFQLNRHKEYALALDMRFMPLYNDNLILFVLSGGRHGHLSEFAFNELEALDHCIAMPTDLIHQGGAIKSQSDWSALPQHLAFDHSASLQRYVSQTDAIGVTTLLASQNDPLFTTGYFKSIRLSGCPVNLVHYLSYRRDHPITDEEADLIQKIQGIYERLNLS